MLTDFWADYPGRRCVVGMKGKRTVHHWFDSTQDAMDKALELDGEGWNVYFTPALFDPTRVDKRREEINPRTGRPYTGREQACVASLPALWLDLDCGEDKDYADQREAAAALMEWIGKVNVPQPTHIVSSGHGLHVYWQLTRLTPREQWEPVAQHLKQACRVHGLLADASRTSDAASLLRPPGTHNRKHGRPVADVKVLVEQSHRIDLQAFRAALPLVGPLGSVPSGQAAGEWDTTVKAPPGDANAIADQCAQMGAMRFTKGAMEEPLWRAGLSVLWRCEDGETFIQAWSTGDDRYDPDETLAKAEATQGPATCRHFAELNPEGCAGCPHAGKVTSPIMLAYAELQPEEDEETGEVTGPTKVSGFTVTDAGVFKNPGAEGGPLTKIADFPVWIEEARELVSANDSKMRSSLVMAWKDVRGRPYRANLTQAELHDTRAWTVWLADHNLISFVSPPLMAQYISRMHKTRFQDRGSRVVYDCLGWYWDHSLFVIGTQGVTPDGLTDVVVDTQGALSELAPKGTLQGWQKAIAMLARPQYQEQAFGLLVGFATPLLDMVERSGGVVAFTGLSGRGKTLAAHAGLSIYGHPKSLEESAGSTHKALGKYLSQVRHVPALIDEVTHMNDHRLRDLIYMAANGRDRSALTQKREMITAATWRTITILTSNHSIVERHQKDIEEAHRRRLVEIPVTVAVSKEDAATFYAGVFENHGVAAGPYIQFLMKHAETIPMLFAAVERTVESWGYDNPADRFGSWTCAAALLGGIMAYAAGVLPFNPLPIVKAATQQAVAANRDRILAPEDQAREVLFELLTTESKRVCVWTHGKVAADPVEDPIARIDGDIVWVRGTALNAAMDENKIFRQALRMWFREMAPLGPEGRHNRSLSPGTPQVKCYGFSKAKLGWKVEDIMNPEDTTCQK